MESWVSQNIYGGAAPLFHLPPLELTATTADVKETKVIWVQSRRFQIQISVWVDVLIQRNQSFYWRYFSLFHFQSWLSINLWGGRGPWKMNFLLKNLSPGLRMGVIHTFTFPPSLALLTPEGDSAMCRKDSIWWPRCLCSLQLKRAKIQHKRKESCHHCTLFSPWFK